MPTQNFDRIENACRKGGAESTVGLKNNGPIEMNNRVPTLCVTLDIHELMIS